MSNETKREVFEDTLDAYDDSRPYPHIGYDRPSKLLDRYNAALPDDLPVIPEAVSEYIKFCKKHDLNITDSLTSMPLQVIYDAESIGDDIFARAWLLGAWCVEETGEIVKLEADD